MNYGIVRTGWDSESRKTTIEAMATLSKEAFIEMLSAKAVVSNCGITVRYDSESKTVYLED